MSPLFASVDFLTFLVPSFSTLIDACVKFSSGLSVSPPLTLLSLLNRSTKFAEMLIYFFKNSSCYLQKYYHR